MISKLRDVKGSVGVVLLNYNTFEDTLKLVKDLQLQTIAKNLSIVIVDNASPNGSFYHLKPLEKIFPNVKVLQTGNNLGYAKGNNFGLNYLKKYINPEYVVILNTDVILPENCLEKLVKKYVVLEEPGIIAPKQIDKHNRETLLYPLNNFLTDCLSLFFITRYFFKHRALSYKDTSGRGAMKVDVIPGSFMFSSFETFNKMGFFYPNTFLFVEERFIAVRAQKMKLNNYVVLDETYIHAHSKTINTTFSQVEKFRMMYEGWLEFTTVCRPYGKIKSMMMRPLMRLSLWEMQVIYDMRDQLKKFRKWLLKE